MMLRFDAYALSSPGGRANNQDAWHAETAGSAACWVVCDGAGGHAGGAEASAIAVREACQSWLRHPGVSPAILVRALQAADDEVVSVQTGNADLADMRTTAVILALDRATGDAAWASVGDSRLYLFRDEEELFRTRDHSLVEELLQAGVLSGDPSRTHPRRNVLTAALGGRDTEVRPGPELIRAEPGDVFLICTDGFWEYVYEPDVALALSLPGLDARAILLRLEERLLARAPSGHDNYTAVLVRVVAD